MDEGYLTPGSAGRKRVPPTASDFRGRARPRKGRPLGYARGAAEKGSGGSACDPSDRYRLPLSRRGRRGGDGPRGRFHRLAPFQEVGDRAGASRGGWGGGSRAVEEGPRRGARGAGRGGC